MRSLLFSIILVSSASSFAQKGPNEMKGMEEDSIGESIVSKRFIKPLRWALPMKLRIESLESDSEEIENDIFARSRIKRKRPKSGSQGAGEKTGD